MLRILFVLFFLFLGCAMAGADPLNCDLAEYRQTAGISAAMEADTLRVTWQGERGQQLRASFGLERGQPVIRELAVRKQGGEWTVLATNLTPEFHVTAGVRRISEQQLAPLRALKIPLTPELIEREKWKVFWDAPLTVPGVANVNPDLPRRPEEIRRATSSFTASGCKVKTEGARLEVSFSGLSLGIFSGRLQFAVYRGANLLRQEAVAKTEEPSVAYKYVAGLKGFRLGVGLDRARRVVWRDVAREWQKYEFGGSPNSDPVPLRARNRLAIVETAAGSVAVFPPPHKFFFAREIELNLGYVWYRKDDASSFSVGVRQADREEMFRPYGVADDLWDRRVRQSRRFAQGNFALYNAPPGTWQRMAAYFYLSAEDGRAAQQAVLAFTHDDRFKALPGYQVAVSHFHTHFGEFVADAGSIDVPPGWVPVFRSLGINIAMMSDFHGDGHPNDPGPLRFREQQTYFEACRRHSDRDFLIMPGEEPDAHFGGHYTMVFPRPVYWSHVRQKETPGGVSTNKDQPFEEKHPQYGLAYHVGSAAEELELLRRENGLVWQAHPRTKGSSGYPDSIRETEYFLSDRYLGGAYQSLPVDLSESRLCEARCFGTLDDMNNWTGPKFAIAEGDTYSKYPDDETYPHLLVNYIKLDRLPAFDESWSPILRAMRAGEFFVTSGEVLIPRFSVEPQARSIRVTAELEWTFPMEFSEVVWGDGAKVHRRIQPMTDTEAFGRKQVTVNIDRAGVKWVRFAAWDSAGNGAFTQPVHVNASR